MCTGSPSAAKEMRVKAAPFVEILEDYDVELYLELLERAMEEVMPPYND